MDGKRAALPVGGAQKDGSVRPGAKPERRFAALDGTSSPATGPRANLAAAVVSGKSPAYGAIHSGDLLAGLASVLHPKADDFHAHFLPPAFGANHRASLAALPDESLRELATSWGYTQIMGYHMVGRAGTVRDLLDPAFHFRLAIELLAEFAAAFQLDLAREFSEMFSCWNTGRPYGRCYSPHYVENGLHRLVIYRELATGT